MPRISFVNFTDLDAKEASRKLTPAGFLLLLLLSSFSFASKVDAQELTLTWTDNSDNELGFVIGQSNMPEGPYVDIASVAANDIIFTVLAGTTQAGIQYCWIVQAYFEYGRSPPSNSLCITVPTIAAPTNLGFKK